MNAGADLGEPAGDIPLLVSAKKFLSNSAPNPGPPTPTVPLLIPPMFEVIAFPPVGKLFPLELLIPVSTIIERLLSGCVSTAGILPRLALRREKFAAEAAAAVVAVRGGRLERAIIEEKSPEPRRLGESIGGGV